MLICGLDMTRSLPRLLLARSLGLTIWPSAKVWLTCHKARRKHQHSSVFSRSGLTRREMRTKDNEDYPLEARNSIHKETFLSRCVNAETRWHKPVTTWALYRVGTSAHDLMHRVALEMGRGRRSELSIDSSSMPPVEVIDSMRSHRCREARADKTFARFAFE